jgi:cyclic 2,3-diphosphoglycerate synthetase
LRADLAVVTMAGSPGLGSDNGAQLLAHLQRSLGDAWVVVTDFLPTPLADVAGRRAFFATTAPIGVAERQVDHLEATHGVEIVGWSARLADRAGLATDLGNANDYEVLLTELKAAAVDVACAHAVSRGLDVVFVDNRAVVVDGDGSRRSSHGSGSRSRAPGSRTALGNGERSFTGCPRLPIRAGIAFSRAVASRRR